MKAAVRVIFISASFEVFWQSRVQKSVERVLAVVSAADWLNFWELANLFGVCQWLNVRESLTRSFEVYLVMVAFGGPMKAEFVSGRCAV